MQTMAPPEDANAERFARLDERFERIDERIDDESRGDEPPASTKSTVASPREEIEEVHRRFTEARGNAK